MNKQRAPFVLPVLAVLAIYSQTMSAETQDSRERSFSLFGGVNFGYSALSTDELDSADGNQLGLGLVGSFYRDDWVFDVGGGWFRNSISGGLPDGTEATIEAKGGFAEISPRYLFGEGWQIGPIADFEFGTALGYSAVDPDAGPNFRIMGGAKLAYELRMNPVDLRFSLKPLTDLTFPDRRNFLVLAGLEVSIPFFGRGPSSAAIVTAPVASAAVEEKPEPVHYDIPLNAVHFKTNSAALDESSRAYLKKLGGALGRSAELWKSVEVNGHTDLRGTHEYNQRLSIRRARSVAQALIEGGAPVDRLREEGFAETKPVDPAKNEKAFSKNRRVELIFLGVADEKALRGMLP